MNFTHLHVHTEYSLLDGSCKIEELVLRAKELGMDSLAITDHGVMYGVIDFYKAAKKHGIKPILGSEVYVSPNSRFDREVVHGEERYYHLVLLAENEEGFKNLTKIVSKGFVDGFYYRPRVDYEVLKEYSKGIIALSACLAGEISRLLLKNEYEKAKEVIRKNKEIFGKDNYFLELQNHLLDVQIKVNEKIRSLAKETDTKLVVTNDVHYIRKEDAVSHDVLLAIQTGKKVSDENRLRYEGGQFYLKSKEQMQYLFPNDVEALENTYEIAKRCEVEIEFGKLKLPEYIVENNKSQKEYLRDLCFKGLNNRYKKIDKTLLERMEYELKTIENMGYVDYFLIVWDYINYAKKNDIPVGPGRGSCAGSLVSYCLGITDVDPIKYNLLFERFLNPERISMPDIDVDFCYEKRANVIEYVNRKYGKDRVCQIITFGTMAARGVIRDVARALDLPYAFADVVAKMIPQELDMTLKKALDTSIDLRTRYENEKDVKDLIDLCMKLEGLPRHSSIHAAGVVISKKSIDEYVPISKNSDGFITTQYTMRTLEDLGLLKMDFLGLRTLTVIKNTILQVKKNYNIDIDLTNLDYDDKTVYKLISTGKTEGIFQLESAGMSSFMRELKPENLDEIIAGISLYRPGPMDIIPKYIKGKNDKNSIEYECEELKPILENTYGCIVYQEQVMQIVRDLAGYTFGRSDLLRRAMSKKKADVMEKERANFVYGNEKENITGCVNNGIDEKVANLLFDKMLDFANYAFNKSHAAAYAFISYQTAYLKTYYPLEFMAALMSSVLDRTSKITQYIADCKDLGIKILPPDINESESEFSVSQGGIRFGLSAIKGIGKIVAKEIIKNREINSKFKNMEEFVSRMSSKEVNKRSLESLIKAGAFDSFHGNRKQKLLIISSLLEKKNKEQKAIKGQMSLFEIVGKEEKDNFLLKLPEVEEFKKESLLAFEKEMLGVYVTGHPLDEYLEILEQKTSKKSTDFIFDIENENRVKDLETVIVGGMLTSFNIKITKNMKTMAFFSLEDQYANLEVVVFPNVFHIYKDILKEDAKLLVKGKVNLGSDESAKLIADSIYDLDALKNKKTLYLQYENKDEYNLGLINLLSILSENKGNDKVYIYLRKEKQKKYMGDEWQININDDLISYLERELGKDNIKVLNNN